MKLTNISNGGLHINGVTAKAISIKKGETIVIEKRLLLSDYQTVLNLFKDKLKVDLEDKVEDKKEEATVELIKDENNEPVIDEIASAEVKKTTPTKAKKQGK